MTRDDDEVGVSRWVYPSMSLQLHWRWKTVPASLAAPAEMMKVINMMMICTDNDDDDEDDSFQTVQCASLGAALAGGWSWRSNVTKTKTTKKSQLEKGTTKHKILIELNEVLNMPKRLISGKRVNTNIIFGSLKPHKNMTKVFTKFSKREPGPTPLT